MNDLKGDLSSLRIDRDRKPSSPWRWPLLLFVPVVALLGLLYVLRARQTLSASEVAVVRASVSAPGQRAAGEQLLTASGYVVARRQAVVSAKIQGRLADLRVEEGSRVEQDEILARLESKDYEAQVRRAQAQVQRAEADLAENRRQFRVAEDLARDQVLAQDPLEAAQSRVRIAEASLRQAEADVA